MAHEMEIYDATKEKRIEKLRIKIVVGYECYVSMNLKIGDILSFTYMLIPNFGILV